MIILQHRNKSEKQPLSFYSRKEQEMSVNPVETNYGWIQGIPMNGFTVFRGIPYAKPPIGDLRFAPPRKPDPFNGIYQADHFGHRGPSSPPMEFYKKEFAYDNTEFFTNQDEDCLYLNIWTPAEHGGEKLPVAFWIHGGAFMNGCGSEIEFDGEAYCRKGIILVTINYRLGFAGFLAHPWLCDEQGGHSGNYGLLDQIAALTWVKENIAAFGGDPNRITIFGQSAGAMSVQHLISSPLTEDMISGAILQSGGMYKTALTAPLDMERACEYGMMLTDYLGIEDISELRSISQQKLLEAQQFVMEKALSDNTVDVKIPTSPVLDHYVLCEPLDAAADGGRTKKIPYMLGYTTNDLMKHEELVALGDDSEDPGPIAPATQALAQVLEKSGSDAYVYCFRHRPLGDNAGAFHSSELWYMFGTLDRSWRPKSREDYLLSEQMLKYWTNFMKTGNPNQPGDAHGEEIDLQMERNTSEDVYTKPWKRYSAEDQTTVMQLF